LVGWKFWKKKGNKSSKSRVYFSIDTTTPSETKKIDIEIEAYAPYEDLIEKAKEMAER